jgi:hypothetical protein
VPGVNVGSGEVFCCCSRARESTETSQACERYVTKVGKLTCFLGIKCLSYSAVLFLELGGGWGAILLCP